MPVATHHEEALSDLPAKVADRLTLTAYHARVACYDVDGVPHFLAPIPSRLHRCRPHTIWLERTSPGLAWRMDFCRCGARRSLVMPDDSPPLVPAPWRSRNTRPRGLHLL